MANWDALKIKKLRKDLGLSQVEFAHRLGCRQQTVSEWELGLYTPANAYGRLLETLQLSVAPLPPSWLINEKSEPAPMMAIEFEEPVREFDPAVD